MQWLVTKEAFDAVLFLNGLNDMAGQRGHVVILLLFDIGRANGVMSLFCYFLILARPRSQGTGPPAIERLRQSHHGPPISRRS